MAELMASRAETSTLSAEGRVVVPASIRKALGLEPGTILTFRVEGNDVMLTTREAAIAKLKKMFAEVRTDSGTLLSDELIAERHAEAARENDDDS
jgi:AbrB family looped-hinge helix DNA binding protein